MNKQIAVTTRTFPAPHDYGRQYAFEIKAEAYQLNGNQHPHFSVTGDIYHKATRTRTGDGTCACGCLHDEASKTWPEIRPIIALHLSDADTGEPMHAEANGYYWLAGVVGGLGEQYHGGSGSDGRTPEQCLAILANHLRITQDEARAIADKVKAAWDAPFINFQMPTVAEVRCGAKPSQDTQKTASILARNMFHDFVNAQIDRWEAEAKAGVELIKKLSNT